MSLEFDQVRVLNPSRFVLSVRLHRKLVDNPYEDQIPSFPGWISNQLDTVLRLKFGLVPVEIANWEIPKQNRADQHDMAQDSSSWESPWQYTEQSGLQRCITDILDKLKHYALPWLEDQNSKDLWPALNQ